MKRFALRSLVAACLVAATFLAGCGSSDTATSAIPLTPIDNTTHGAAAASVGLQAQGVAIVGVFSALFSPMGSDFISPTGGAAPVLNGPQDPRARLASGKIAALAGRIRNLGAVSRVYAPLRGDGGPRVAVSDNGSMTGPGGGYFTWRRSFDSGTGAYSIELAFFDYRDNVTNMEAVNGTLSDSGKIPLAGANPAAVTVSLRLGKSAAEPLTIDRYTDSTLSVLQYRDSFYLVMNADETMTSYPGGVDNASLALNLAVPAGTIRETSGPGGTGDNLVVAYNGYGVNIALRNYGDNTSSFSVAANGSFQFDFRSVSGNASFGVTYTNMRWTEKARTNVSSDTTIDGIVAFAFTPVLSCTNGVDSWTYGGGTYAYATTIPIHYDMGLGRTTAGRVTINGVVVVTFNADGSVTVTVNGKTVDLSQPDTTCTILPAT